MKVIKIFSFLLTMTLLLSFFSLFVSANEDNEFPDTTKADAVCLYNLNTQKTVYSKNFDKKIFPAGAVKMMTGLLACEILSNRLDEAVEITADMLHGATGYNIKLREGMRVTVEDLLYGALCGGGNDASLALAALCGEDIEGFVSFMNSKAREWGLKNTVFTNPTGIDDEDMYSTLSDIMVITQKAQENDLYMKISSAVSYSYTPMGTNESLKFFNRNYLMRTDHQYNYKNPNAYGLAVGNTELGGNCVITYAQQNDTRYICAVMGADQDNDNIYSYKIANELLSHAFKNLSYVKIAEIGKQVCSANTVLALPQSQKDVTVSCVIKDDVYALTGKNIDLSRIEYRCYLHNDVLRAPISAGVVVGGVDIMYNGEIIGNAKLVSAEYIPSSGILVFLEQLKQFFTGRVFILSVAFFVIIFFSYYYLVELKHKHKNAAKVQYRNFY